MQAQNIVNPDRYQHARFIKKEFSAKGSSSIQFHSLDKEVQGSFYLEQNALLIVTKGKLAVRYGSSQYEVNQHEIAFFKKNIFLEFQTLGVLDDEDKVEYFLFLLSEELVKEFMKLNDVALTPGVTPLPVLVNCLNQQIIKYVDTLETFSKEISYLKSSLVRIKLLELLFYLSGFENNILHQVYDIRNEFRTDITSTVEENIMNSLSLQQLAVMSGRSLSSFRRDFLAIYNMPPSHYIRQKRLEKARELLRSTTMTVTDICYTLGFENIAHFSRLFKSHFQYSPTEYRLVEFAA